MMLMCIMAKPLWGSGKKVIMGSVIFVLKGLLLCLREGSMEMNWQKNNIYLPAGFYGYRINANCKINV